MFVDLGSVCSSAGVLMNARSERVPTKKESNCCFQEGIMIKFVSFLAIIAFALSASPVEAAKKKTPVATASARVKSSPPTGSSRVGTYIALAKI
jgi:hypothetical protein